jgi:hypothetical protein
MKFIIVLLLLIGGMCWSALAIIDIIKGRPPEIHVLLILVNWILFNQETDLKSV